MLDLCFGLLGFDEGLIVGVVGEKSHQSGEASAGGVGQLDFFVELRELMGEFVHAHHASWDIGADGIDALAGEKFREGGIHACGDASLFGGTE